MTAILQFFTNYEILIFLMLAVGLMFAMRALIRARQEMSESVFGLERELLGLQGELVNGTYAPGPYRRFVVHEGKKREICAAPYRDRVLHHALCGVLEPVLEPAFYHHSYACRKDKGTHLAILAASRWARSSRYVLKCDIVKFYPSTDHGILKAMLARKIRDREVLRLCELVIDSWRETGNVAYFPGDGLFTPVERPRGIPIGTSTRPGFVMAPARAKTFVPFDFSVPIEAYQAAPFRMIGEMFANVSTLFRHDGLPQRPLFAGNGGRGRGSPRLPSMLVIRAVSSPHTNAPEPIRISTSKSNLRPMMFLPRRPYSRACSRAFENRSTARGYSARR